MIEFDIRPAGHPVPDAEREALLAAPGFGQVFTDHMITLRWTAERGWHDGKLEPYGPFSLDPATAVFHYGQELFEGLKAYKRDDGGVNLFRPDANARRFQNSAERMAMAPLPEPVFVEAVIATEDSEFRDHGGVDPKAIARAVLKDVIERRRAQGASTLTQQLAKQVFLTPEKSFRRKINEIFLAVQIEKDFTKDQIFELYANQVYLGHGAYGVEAASRLYFGKHAKELTLPEGAVLAEKARPEVR